MGTPSDPVLPPPVPQDRGVNDLTVHTYAIADPALLSWSTAGAGREKRRRSVDENDDDISGAKRFKTFDIEISEALAAVPATPGIDMMAPQPMPTALPPSAFVLPNSQKICMNMPNKSWRESSPTTGEAPNSPSGPPSAYVAGVYGIEDYDLDEDSGSDSSGEPDTEDLIDQDFLDEIEQVLEQTAAGEPTHANVMEVYVDAVDDEPIISDDEDDESGAAQKTKATSQPWHLPGRSSLAQEVLPSDVGGAHATARKIRPTTRLGQHKLDRGDVRKLILKACHFTFHANSWPMDHFLLAKAEAAQQEVREVIGSSDASNPPCKGTPSGLPLSNKGLPRLQPPASPYTYVIGAGPFAESPVKQEAFHGHDPEAWAFLVPDVKGKGKPFAGTEEQYPELRRHREVVAGLRTQPWSATTAELLGGGP
ncbi:hypothetical protein C8Q78DRAFT_1100870 [Trametes maxima]|nr:hypothetical protein C8Q78DRAFT_1100870 [Trametes maxima]